MLPPAIGTYDIVSLLGHGAMGVVYRARHPILGDVALKVIRRELSRDPGVEQRFRRETRLALGLRHPNVVRALDAGSAEGYLYLATEVVPGGSLAEELRKRSVLDEKEARRLLRDTLRGLEAIHAVGLVHRDIKPSNILLDRDGGAKIADLGLARSTEERRSRLTGSGLIVGTPAYLSPEQVVGNQEIDIRSDLYALGIVLYECLAGRLPFPEEPAATYARVQTDAPRLDAGRVPRDLVEVTEALLARHPESRPLHPAAVLALLGDSPTRDFAVSSDTVTEVMLQPAGTLTGRGTSGLARARLEFGETTLQVHGGARLRVGRGNRDSGNDVRLCLLPEARYAKRSLKISRRHFEVRWKRGRFEVRDLRTRFGTTLDDRTLKPGVWYALASEVPLEVAEVLTLRLVTVAPPVAPSLFADDPAADALALLLRRVANGSEHAYALVPGRLDLSLLVPGAPARAELRWFDDSLWIRDEVDTPDRYLPVVDGYASSWGLKARAVPEGDEAQV